MAQLKIINNTNQKIEIMLQDQRTKSLKGVSLIARDVKIIDTAEVSSQLKSLANRQIITLIEM